MKYQTVQSMLGKQAQNLKSSIAVKPKMTIHKKQIEKPEDESEHSDKGTPN